VSRHAAAGTALAAILLLSAFQAPPKPEEQLAAVLKAWFAVGQPAGWEAIDSLPGFRWSETGPRSLQRCLPNGDCYARQGTASIAGRNLVAVASGARTMVMTLALRNTGAPFGESALVAGLRQAGLTAELARCPVREASGASRWYRMSGSGPATGFLQIQPAGPGRPSEGFMITQGNDLPALPAAQVALYSEQCAPGVARNPVSTVKPPEAIAEVIVALLAQTAGAALYDWAALAALPTGIRWLGDGPVPTDLTSRGDPNPVSRSGDVALGGRRFSVLASGTVAQVKTVYFEESGLHPRGEHVLGVVHAKGVAVRLVRCGPVYSESTNNWYSLSSARTRPAHIRQSIRYDGNQVQDAYELRLDGTLPARDPRDRNPGQNGC
jgi:hypothetical protein